MTTVSDPGLKPPVLDMDPYSTEVLSDPYPFQVALRNLAPVVELNKYGVYAVGGYDEAKIVLADFHRFSSAGGVGIQDIRKPGNFRIPSRLVESDPPEHTKVRTALMRVLTPPVIRQWREMFERVADEMVDGILARGHFDGVEDLTEPYIFKVFPMATGVRLSRTETLAIGEMRFNQSGPENELHQQALERARPYLEWFQQSCQREFVKPGSIGEQIFLLEDCGAIDPGTASNLLTTFVGGGTDSTISGIGFALFFLASNPDQWELARSEPARIRNALDEAIRLEMPFQVGYRTTTAAPVKLAGYTLKPETKLAVFFQAANRDPRQFAQPDKFDLTRSVAGISLGFGTGHHACIGQMIARLEAECLLGALLRKVKRIELAGAPTYRLMNQMRTYRHLPLRVEAIH